MKKDPIFDNKNQADIPADLSRRDWIFKFLALGVGGISSHVLASFMLNPLSENLFKQKNNQEYNDNQNKIGEFMDLSQKDALIDAEKCVYPNVETRLFASSGVALDAQKRDRAITRLTCMGFDIQNPEIMQRRYLRFAGTDQQRADDLNQIALTKVNAPDLLLGVRGGYGAMRLLPMIDWQRLGKVLQEKGTVLAGFSDVTAVQSALLAQANLPTLAAPMAYGEFGSEQINFETIQNFIQVLTQDHLSIEVHDSQLSTGNFVQSENQLEYDEGQNNFDWALRLAKKLPCILSKKPNQSITGQIWGGNLSVISALAGTPYLPKPKGGIVFLEDVSEHPYHIERMLYGLYLSGAFDDQQAIVLGGFSAMKSDGYDKSYNMIEVIYQLHALTRLPIYSGLAVGHIAPKFSLPLGALCQISPLSDGGFRLDLSHYPILQNKNIDLSGLV